MRLDENQKNELQRRIGRTTSFQAVFIKTGKDGEDVLKELEKQLVCFDENPYRNAFESGKRFMYEFIIKCIEGKGLEEGRKVLNAQSKT